MLKAFEKNLINNHLLEKGESVLVAISGGVDSMVLLHLLDRLKKTWKLDLHVAHVNHNLRGKEANADQAFVRKVCRQAKMKFHTVKWNPPKRGNIQEAARNFRYKFLYEQAQKLKIRYILTAHHQDDQAETVLLQLIRGSGIKGLCGMTDISEISKNCLIIRPCLEFSRQDIEKYARRFKVAYVEDSSNQKKYYTRNRVRHELIPLLEDINPSVKQAVAQAASAIRHSHEALDLIARTYANDYFLQTRKRISWERKNFVELPNAIRRQVLMEAFRRLRGDLNNLNADQIRHMDDLSLIQKTTSQYMLPKQIKFFRNKDLLGIEC
ncbi:MAG: tRNA lysidine(34) synthetase TilS [Pseudomonadota bacterium]